jgi:hypothetical protein
MQVMLKRSENPNRIEDPDRSIRSVGAGPTPKDTCRTVEPYNCKTVELIHNKLACGMRCTTCGQTSFK